MIDPTEIFLQPECCADPDAGRLWCEDDAPVDCEDDVPWTRYVRADLYDALREAAQRVVDAALSRSSRNVRYAVADLAKLLERKP
jgi:hypothetical protein